MWSIWKTRREGNWPKTLTKNKTTMRKTKMIRTTSLVMRTRSRHLCLGSDQPLGGPRAKNSKPRLRIQTRIKKRIKKIPKTKKTKTTKRRMKNSSQRPKTRARESKLKDREMLSSSYFFISDDHFKSLKTVHPYLVQEHGHIHLEVFAQD